MRFKRTVSLALVLVLLFTCQCLTAFATDSDVVQSTDSDISEVVLLGTFNDWAGTAMQSGNEVEFSTTLELEAGNYQFKIKNGDTEYGHPGTIKDTTVNVSSSGWMLSDSINAKCTLIATGGSYTFIFNTENNKLQVIMNNETATDSEGDALTVNFGNGTAQALVGDTLTYTVYLTADKPFEDIQSTLSYNEEKLSLIRVTSTDAELSDAQAEAIKYCPNISDVIYNGDCEGVVAANASNVEYYDYTEEKVFLTLEFTVLKGGVTALEFTVQEMTASDGTACFAYSNKASQGAETRETVDVKKQPAKVSGYSLSLSGNIEVKFHMELSENIVADAGAKVVFTLPNGNKRSVPVNNATEKDGLYVFACEVAAKQMVSVVKAQVVASDYKSEVFEYSVKEYAEYILKNPADYEKEIPLVKAMLNYGASAQNYFGYNVENLANAGLTDEDKVLSEVDFTEYKPVLTGSENGVSYYGSRLSLESETAIKHYFFITDEEKASEIKVNGKEVTAVKKDGLYEIKISDIPSQNLGGDYVVTIGGLTLDYNAFSYGYLAMNGSDTGLQNVVKALYAYNQAAINYCNGL